MEFRTEEETKVYQFVPQKFNPNITIHDNNNISRRYHPQEDITPYEVAKLLGFFVCVMVVWPSDAWDYLVEEKLDRHFCANQ